MCGGLDAGSRRSTGDRIDAASAAAGRRAGSDKGGVQRDCVGRRPDSQDGLIAAGSAMWSAVSHAHGNVPGRVLEGFENAWHGLRTHLLCGAAQPQAGFNGASLIGGRTAKTAGAQVVLFIVNGIALDAHLFKLLEQTREGGASLGCALFHTSLAENLLQ